MLALCMPSRYACLGIIRPSSDIDAVRNPKKKSTPVRSIVFTLAVVVLKRHLVSSYRSEPVLHEPDRQPTVVAPRDTALYRTGRRHPSHAGA